MSVWQHLFKGPGSLAPARWLILIAICGAAALLALEYLRIGINESPSIDARVVLVVRGLQPDARGQHVVFRWAGGNGIVRPGEQLVKIVAGLPGDEIAIGPDRLVRVAGAPVGIAKPYSSKGIALEAIAPGRIPADKVFLAGQSVDSFDSRYRTFGLLGRSEIVGRAYVLY